MKTFIVLSIVAALIPGISYAADTGTSEALIVVIEKKLDEIKSGQFQNYRLGDGTPDPFVSAIIAKAQQNAAANGNGPTLLSAINSAHTIQTAPNPFGSGSTLLSAIDSARTIQAAPPPPGVTSTCVNNQVTANTGVYYSNRDCSAAFTANRAWVQAHMYDTGNYILQASWGNIDFGHAKAGQAFAVHYTPTGDAREFVWLINATN